MENTLLVGDFLFVNKALYGAEIPLVHKRLPAFREPQRNDILVFDSVEEPIDVVKRMVGMPGDTLAMEGGQLIRNGERLVEPYVVHASPLPMAAPEQRLQMRRWQVKYLVGRDTATYNPEPAGLGADRRAPRFVLHDGRQPGQLPRQPDVGIPAAEERAGPPDVHLLQLRRQQLETGPLPDGHPMGTDLQPPEVAGSAPPARRRGWLRFPRSWAEVAASAGGPWRRSCCSTWCGISSLRPAPTSSTADRRP
jgi:hypothetical protein